MNNKLIIIALSLISSAVFAQKNIDSPYSNYGIGTLRSQATEENRLMGGIEVYNDSIHLNLQNPAAYGSLKYTTFIAGATLSKNKLSTENKEADTKNSTFDYMALGFPITKKMGVGIGLIPFSSVGYKITSQQTISNRKIISQHNGKGGINRAFLSTGYEIIDGWNVGLSFNFNFGNIESTHLRSEENVQLATQEFNKSFVKGLSYRIGTSYKKAISDKLTLMSSVSFSPKVSLATENSRDLSTLEYLQNGSIVVRDSQKIKLTEDNSPNTEFIIPSQISIGAGVGENKKWFAGINYSYLGTSEFNNSFATVTNVSYKNSYIASLGGFYIPQYNSFTNYLKRITYRFGIRYEKTGILIKNQSIDDFGISFGFSLPLRGFSNATIGLEYGQKGTTQDNLVKENYFKLRVGFSFNDRWFQKTKYQ